MCDGRSIWTIDCRKFDDPDKDRSLKKHIGRNPKIMQSILESENYHARHSRLYDGMHWFFFSKNIVIMICRSGRRRSVANAEMCSNTLTRCSRHQHSVSLLHKSELDFSENTGAGNCSEYSKQSLRVFVPDPVRSRRKRPRPEQAEGPAQPAKDPLDDEQTTHKRATSATATPAETNPSRGILDELAERLGNFHESARTLASCLQNHDLSRTDQSMIEAGKCMLHKLLGEASDDLERVTPRSRESLCTRPRRRRCSRSEAPRRLENLVLAPRCRARNLCGKRQQNVRRCHNLQLSHWNRLPRAIHACSGAVPQYKLGEWKYQFKATSFTRTILNLLYTEAEDKGKTRHFRMCIGPGSDGSSADKLSLDLKFNPWDTAITYRPEWRPMSKIHAVRPIRNLVHMSERRVARRGQHVLSSTTGMCDRCSSVFACSGGIPLPLVCKNMH